MTRYVFNADIERGGMSVKFKFMQLFAAQAVCEAIFNSNFFDKLLSKAVFENWNKKNVRILLCVIGIAMSATKPVLFESGFLNLIEIIKQNHYICVLSNFCQVKK